jgi:GntR family transcriptional regulator/MocR family aminotransferase
LGGYDALVDVHVSLVGRKSLATEIYSQLRGAILDGRLRPNAALPPSRELARRLSVSRATVTVAYDRLAGEGFVTSRVGAGTFVSPDASKVAYAPARAADALQPRPLWAAIPTSTAFARRAEFDFRTGVPDAASFPYQTWRRLMTRELHSAAAGAGQPGDPAGERGLREAIARHVGISRGIRISADAVVVTNGTQQALDLLARVLLKPGDRVAVEDPGYRPAHLLLESLGMRVQGVPVDSEGLVAGAIPGDARAVYVTPSHQYPLGMTMSLPRRIALLAWAERHNAAIIEDDYDSEFRFGDRPIEPLHALDSTGRVIYTGSFSKTMLPTLRLGFLAAPPSLRHALRAAKYVTDWHTSLPAQKALAGFIDEGRLARHIRKMRALYRVRHQKIADTLARDFSANFALIPSSAGLHVTAVAKTLSVDEVDAFAEAASAAGVAIQPLSMFAAGGQPVAGVALGYGAIAASSIDEGLRRLRLLLR